MSPEPGSGCRVIAKDLAHYRILDKLGEGAMGEVYRARDLRLGRTVAIKVLPQAVATDPARRDRFMREAHASAALSHPNIAALFEIGEDAGHLFLAFEFIPGQTLSQEIAGHALNPRQAIHLAMQIADALADAHAAGIVHRDLKPDNVIVTPKGNAKVLDFGLAKWTGGGAERDRAATTLATEAGVALGTAAYMSPEQAMGDAADPRTDIFSLGIVLYEMLTGVRPFQGTTSTAVALQIVQGEPTAPSIVNRNVPPELDAIVSHALAKKPDQRYESAATLAAELRAVDAILDVRSEASERASAATASRLPGHSAGLWVVALAVIAVLGVSAWWARPLLQRSWRHTLGPLPAPVIAVVPFETDADRTSFADGLAEDLITRLGQTPGLKVMGRSVTRSFRGKEPRDVARETGAAVVLTGSVRPLVESVKMSFELIDPDDGTAIWSSQYTRDVKDIFAVQAEVADAVASALRVKLQPTASSARAASRTVDPKAYDLYVRGRQALVQRRDESIGLFEQAIAVDPGLAEAFAGIVEAMEFRIITGGLEPDTAARQRQRAAAERAYQLDPDLPQANLAMGITASGLKEALGFLRRAVEVDPSYGEGLHQIADQIVDFDPALAIDFYRASLKADPGLEAGHTDMSLALLALNRIADAHAEVDRMRNEPFPGWRDAFHVILDLDERQPERALNRVRQSKLPPQPKTAITVRTLATMGRFREALNEGVSQPSNAPCSARAVYAGARREAGDKSVNEFFRRTIASARTDGATPEAMRCGAYAAAASNDLSAVADILGRIADREEWLRYWALQITIDRGSIMLRGRIYPWNHAADAPALVNARQKLDDAYTHERQVARSVLTGLLQ